MVYEKKISRRIRHKSQKTGNKKTPKDETARRQLENDDSRRKKNNRTITGAVAEATGLHS